MLKIQSKTVFCRWLKISFYVELLKISFYVELLNGLGVCFCKQPIIYYKMEKKKKIAIGKVAGPSQNSISLIKE